MAKWLIAPPEPDARRAQQSEQEWSKWVAVHAILLSMADATPDNLVGDRITWQDRS